MTIKPYFSEWLVRQYFKGWWLLVVVVVLIISVLLSGCAGFGTRTGPIPSTGKQGAVACGAECQKFLNR